MRKPDASKKQPRAYRQFTADSSLASTLRSGADWSALVLLVSLTCVNGLSNSGEQLI
jgi:hypothetical protein